MGHNVFLDRNNKPNFRIHIIIFVIFAGISIFLSTLVEKNKVNSNITALKEPVPLDSIEIDSKSSTTTLPAIKPPVVEKAVLNAAVYAQVESVETNTIPAAVINSNSNTTEINTAEISTIVAVNPVANGDLPVNVDVSIEEKTAAHNNELVDPPVAAVEHDSNADKKAQSINMDQAYQDQQDRFLTTLAKSAELESMDSTEIDRIKDAILHDKTLKPAGASESGQPRSLSAAQDSQGNDGDTSPHAIKTRLNNAAKDEMRSRVSTNNKASTKLASLHNGNNTVDGQGHNKVSNAPSQGELDHILSQFTLYYNEGDIMHLMSLFASNASTNDRQNKLGIRQDYNELFQNTVTRQLKIKGMQWNLGKGIAEGQASFEVAVRPKNSGDISLYKGSIKIVAVKESNGVYITHLMHEVDPQ